MPYCKLTSSSSADFHSLILCTFRIQEKRETRRGTRVLAIHCVLRPARLSDGGLTHMERTGQALSSASLTVQCLPGRAERPGDLPHLGSLPSSQSMQPGVNGNKNRSSFFLSTHPSLCSARICNTHLGNYSLLFPRFTFCFQDSPCFSPQNNHKSALYWFTLLFYLYRIAGVSSGGRGRDAQLISVADPIPQCMK